MDTTKHSTREDERGWTREHHKPRNLLNKQGSRKRIGTLGYRTQSAANSTKWVNPRKGKVNPPAPVTKRARPTLEYVMGDTSMGAAVNLQSTAKRKPPTTDDEWRAQLYG